MRSPWLETWEIWLEDGIMSQRMAVPSEVELNCLPINQTTRNTPLSPQGKDNPVM